MTTPVFSLETTALALEMTLVPWDSKAFGFPVAQIGAFRLSDAASAAVDIQSGWAWLDEERVQLASCRLDHTLLAESFFLEEQGFRFVEMVLHPKIENLGNVLLDDNEMEVSFAEEEELPELAAIAESAFGCERYHVDPRVDSNRANLRYSNWVRCAFSHPRQRVLKVKNREGVVAVFVIETADHKKVYWHLTAVAPRMQGQGLGWLAWRAMMRYHQLQKIECIETTISARNVRVLNLYSRLGCRFLPPEMTFHWLRN